MSLGFRVYSLEFSVLSLGFSLARPFPEALSTRPAPLWDNISGLPFRKLTYGSFSNKVVLGDPRDGFRF